VCVERIEKETKNKRWGGGRVQKKEGNRRRKGGEVMGEGRKIGFREEEKEIWKNTVETLCERRNGRRRTKEVKYTKKRDLQRNR
jgi:hypothetical protein